MNLKEVSTEFSNLLGLERQPIAIHIFDNNNDFDNWEAQEVSTPLSFCALVRLASLGHSRKTKKNGIRCPGALDVFGFSQKTNHQESINRLLSMGLYKDSLSATKAYATMAKLSKPCHGLAINPLSQISDRLPQPNITLFIVDPYQAMRLIQAWSYHFGMADNFLLTGNRGICSESVVKPYISQQIHLSTLCANTRYTCHWKKYELGIGIPFHQTEFLLTGLLKTAESIEPYQQKQVIKKRYQQSDRHSPKLTKSAYFEYQKN